jgi:hypothetical protein
MSLFKQQPVGVEMSLLQVELKCKVEIIFKNLGVLLMDCLQRPALGPQKQWRLYIGDCCLEVFQSKVLLNLIWPGLGWPLLAGGRCLEVAIKRSVSQ